jgi:anaerobic ribonucleoside-triphosphate reductase activating protein
VLREVKNKYPTIKTFVWTGFTIEELIDDKNITILDYIDVLIDGRYIAEERDLTLPLRGSRNQRILRKGIDFKKNNKGEQNLDKHKNL